MMAYSEEAETPSEGDDMEGKYSCYSTTLARAKSYSKNYMKNFLDCKNTTGAELQQSTETNC